MDANARLPFDDDEAAARHERRVAALHASLARLGAPAPVRIDTHISTVLVAPPHAFKLKRQVRLPFVDLSDPVRRRALCIEEVRLNRRLAASLYLGVIAVDALPPSLPWPVDGDERDAPEGELAVVMRAFEPEALWALRVPAGGVDADDARALGDGLGRFHRDRAARVMDAPHARADAVLARALENVVTLRGLGTVGDTERLDRLASAARRRAARLGSLRDARNRHGFVRDGHGDLHLGNVVTFEGAPVPFDCLEFDARLRVADVADDIAFVLMDLRHAGRPDLAAALLDGWLQATGDFDAVALLDDACAYRAMVRAKVSAIGASQRDEQRGRDPCAGYLELADGYDTRPAAPLLVATHGLSGSGKTVLSGLLAAELGAVRLRSDVERKRMLGLPLDARGAVSYANADREAVYVRLEAIARGLLSIGWSVVVDAACLARAQRRRFAELAASIGAGFAIADVDAPIGLLRERVAARARRGDDASDADLAVLEAQRRTHESLDAHERAVAIRFDASLPFTRASVVSAWRARGCA
jgi:aminoglycoside phosphotransferase family enzyme/predicted kinase